MPLTDVAVRSARPRHKAFKLFDERGLYLLIDCSGGRWWRFKYRIDGREKLLSLDTFPDTPLKRAREKRDEARRLVADGVDPSAVRQSGRANLENTFEGIAREHLALQRKKLGTRTFDKKMAWFEQHVFPFVGRLPITKVTAPELLGMLRRVEARGNHETAHRMRSGCGGVFRFAIATGRAERDPTADLRGALAPVVTRNRSAITDPLRIGALLRAMDIYNGQPATTAALRLAPLVFVRPGELRGAEWQEITLTGHQPEWRIPLARMKMGEEHVVPLSR